MRVYIIGNDGITLCREAPRLRFSTPGSAFHSASNRLALSGAACSSSFDATAISPLLTVAGAVRHA